MTIRLPPDNLIDQILAIFSKKRKIIFPNDINKTEQKLGPYVNIKTKKEGFFKTLFNRRQ